MIYILLKYTLCCDYSNELDAHSGFNKNIHYELYSIPRSLFQFMLKLKIWTRERSSRCECIILVVAVYLNIDSPGWWLYRLPVNWPSKIIDRWQWLVWLTTRKCNLNLFTLENFTCETMKIVIEENSRTKNEVTFKAPVFC